MKLSKVLKELNSSKDIENFLLDLCTPSEIEAMEERWEVANYCMKVNLHIEILHLNLIHLLQP